MPIYLKLPEGTKFKTVFELLAYGFHAGNDVKFKFEKTYHDAECTRTQCDEARRSLEDLLEIVKVYFPSMTDKRLIKLMYKRRFDLDLYFHWCPNIQKFVFLSYRGTKNIDHLIAFYVDEYPDKADKGRGRYSYDDIMVLINS